MSVCWSSSISVTQHSSLFYLGNAVTIDMFLGAVGFLSCFLGLHLHKLVGSHLVGNA
ncbi:hypothetical protein [Nostoc sp. NMS8]|uniref:hypothetical protein n=1 Tax=Nostoc sp. NMS8 TaxID=2815392 RepID=UPI0025CEFC70|nr:hypothetical protein [Nostoc sp. NMS8]MBN3960929.1 hypothetical protein [Nostoc sp. NMS8]